jgi:inositol-phosphate transport system permease protein
MSSETVSTTVSGETVTPSPLFDLRLIARAVRNGLLVMAAMAFLAVILEFVLGHVIVSAGVEQSVTNVLARLLIFLLPFAGYMVSSGTVREIAKSSLIPAVVTAVIAAGLLFGILTIANYLFKSGPFAARPSLQFTLAAVDDGALVTAIVPGGAADAAELQVGDVITGIRRDNVTASDLANRIATAEVDTPLRLRILRDGDELQLTARTVFVAEPDSSALIGSLIISLIIAIIVVFWPSGWTPYVILILLLSPLVAGYIWLIIATFSYRTEGLTPIGGMGLDNWGFLFGEDIAGLQFTIWRIALNSLAIAVAQMVMVLLVSSPTGYALSRMNFAGRKSFLSFTLILHGFPAITLLIPVFFILRYIGNIPIIGALFGFNTIGGIALAMVAFELPLGVWLMKGFFDNIPWDMERSALIDGASRFRTYWEILLPQIRPGLLALGIFAFISGWNAYLIPQTYSVGSQATNITVFMNQLISETAPTDWNQVAAVGLFQLIPIFLFFIFAQEYLLNIYAGGSKGTS